MTSSFRFDRMELAGSLGDLGTLLPLAIGMIMINGLHSLGALLGVGLHALALIHLLPMAVLGILLVFAGTQLSITLLDMENRKELCIPIMIVGITLASNLAAGFLVGIGLSLLLKIKQVDN